MGEVLEPGLRRLARETWGVPVRDNYSCEELGILALECPAAEGKLHVQAERALLEVVDDAGQPVPPGGVGRVLATGLFNYATPLIRYELGDRAVLGGPCRCGRGLPVLDRLVGRERQSVRLPSGARLFPTLDFEPLLLAGGVRQYQVVQTGVEEMRLNLVADRPLAAEAEAAIVERLRHNFGHPFRFDFVYLEAIPRGPGGKFQLFRSELG
jgi:phenylacetate-CoA ligase